ncbi:MAG TPA: enoyl-CoA hydratase/isomerase family protein [Actinomycetota bacterium]|nr:enoyl-CoA hydratase/isomerase family protein [Actinomycetota bacterium]
MSPLRVEEHDGVAVLTMDRPPVNATDVETLDALTEAFEAAEDAKAIVLTGAGRVFSAGADLQRVLNGGPEYIEAGIDALTRCFKALFTLPRPVVAAINGHALAGGCVLGCGCDYGVISPAARIGAIEHAAGVPFPAWALELVRFGVNNEHAAEVILFGRAYDAATAREMGIVDEVADGDVLGRGLDVAHELGSIPARTFAITKRSLRHATVEAADRLAEATDDEVKRQWCSDEVLTAIRAQLDSLRA